MASSSTPLSLPSPSLLDANDSLIAVEEQPAVFRRCAQKSISSVPLPCDKMKFLEEWIKHDDHSYHLDFLPPPRWAYGIRLALVEWYRPRQQKLLWRGNAGLHDGSTAGFGSGSAAGNKRKGDGEGQSQDKTKAQRQRGNKDAIWKE